MRKPVKKKKTVRKIATSLKTLPPVQPLEVPPRASINYAYNTPDEIVRLISGHGSKIEGASYNNPLGVQCLEGYINTVRNSAERVLFLLKDLRELPHS
jgi:hypothetical protein